MKILSLLAILFLSPLAPASTGTLNLKSAEGYKDVPIKEIKSLRLSIPPPLGKKGHALTKVFSGEKLTAVITKLGLDKPTEPGLPGALISGSVIITLEKSDAIPRTLNLLNNRLLQDSAFKEVIYHPTETIDRAWLESQ